MGRWVEFMYLFWKPQQDFSSVLSGFQPLDVEELKNDVTEKKQHGFADCMQPAGESWRTLKSLNPVESLKSSRQSPPPETWRGIRTESLGILQPLLPIGTFKCWYRSFTYDANHRARRRWVFFTFTFEIAAKVSNYLTTNLYNVSNM